MRRETTEWYCERLYLTMPLVTFGHAGVPILMVPTAAADYLEYERFQLIDYMKPWIEAGKIRLYSINSVNKQSLLDNNCPPHIKIEYLERYDQYIVEEVLPYIRKDVGSETPLPYIMGISMGGYLAGNTFFKHPDLFGGAILMSGSYDIRGYMGGFHNDTVYYNNPAEYLPKLSDPRYLGPLQDGSRQIIIFTGQGEYEDPRRSQQLADMLKAKKIPHWLDMWGYDVKHDWPWWYKAVPYYLDHLFGPP